MIGKITQTCLNHILWESISEFYVIFVWSIQLTSVRNFIHKPCACIAQSNRYIKLEKHFFFVFSILLCINRSHNFQTHIYNFHCHLKTKQKQDQFKYTHYMFLLIQHNMQYAESLHEIVVNTYTARPVCWSGWISDSYCSLKPLCSGMGEVVPARTSPTLLPPSPRTVLSFSCFKVLQCINCRDRHCKS